MDKIHIRDIKDPSIFIALKRIADFLIDEAWNLDFGSDEVGLEYKLACKKSEKFKTEIELLSKIDLDLNWGEKKEYKEKGYIIKKVGNFNPWFQGKLALEDLLNSINSLYDFFSTTEYIEFSEFLHYYQFLVGQIPAMHHDDSIKSINLLQIFLSYSSEDKEFIGQVKQRLERYGLSVFAAHDDISASAEWEEIIIEMLKKSQIFIPVISENFRQSKWTDQESGIAYVLKSCIIPISLNKKMPYGFLGKYQAQKYSGDVNILCREIISIIAQNNKYKDLLFNSLLKVFSESYNFDNAGVNANLLLSFNSLNKNQITKVMQATLDNGQILFSSSAKRNLIALLKKNIENIDKKMVNRINKILLEKGERTLEVS